MKHLGKILSWAIVLALPVFAIWAYLNHQAIYDWYRLRDYTPSAAIVQLAADTTMNDPSRHLFYIQHPQLNDAQAFNHNCGQIGEVTIVLGCYISGQGIYIFDIEDDPRLHGVEQVTAAHELLHAAYDRLSQEEREEVDRLTAQAFSSLTDERIIKNVESYRNRDSSVVPNELHSILGTEVRNLPDQLEQYYKRYFNDRQRIVAYSESYESELTSRRNRASSLEVQIAGIKQEIDLLESTLATERSALESQRSSANTQAEVDAFNARVNAYNDSVHRLNDLINQHNALVAEYQAIALEQQELYDALNSQPTL